MKILMVTNYFKPSWESGGVTRCVYDLSISLLERGHDITVYTTNVSDIDYRVPTNEQIDLDGLHVYYFENLRRFAPAILRQEPFPIYAPLVAFKNVKEFDIVHIHSHRTLLEFIVGRACIKSGVPYILQPHGSLPYDLQKKALKRTFDLFVGNGIVKQCSAMVAVSATEARQFTNYGVEKEKVSIIPNGISDELLIQPSSLGYMRSKLGVGKETKIVLFVGRLHRIKGIVTLLKAFKRICESIPGTVLAIVGPDSNHGKELRKMVEELDIKDSVFFIGYDPKAWMYYDDADVLVYPSTYEIFGLVPFEGLARNVKAVVVTRQCGCGEIISKINAGYLFDQENIDDLTSSIMKSLLNPEEAKTCSERGKRFVLEELKWSKLASDYERLYEDCISDI